MASRTRQPDLLSRRAENKESDVVRRSGESSEEGEWVREVHAGVWDILGVGDRQRAVGECQLELEYIQ